MYTVYCFKYTALIMITYMTFLTITETYNYKHTIYYYIIILYIIICISILIGT